MSTLEILDKKLQNWVWTPALSLSRWVDLVTTSSSQSSHLRSEDHNSSSPLWATILFRGPRVKLGYIWPYPIMRNFQCYGEEKGEENLNFLQGRAVKREKCCGWDDIFELLTDAFSFPRVCISHSTTGSNNCIPHFQERRYTA